MSKQELKAPVYMLWRAYADETAKERREVKMAKLHTIRVVVQQRGTLFVPFPIDMLRYDGVSPNSEADSGEINRSFNSRRYGSENKEPIVVTVKKLSHGSKKWLPESARWESFGWEVIEVIPDPY